MSAIQAGQIDFCKAAVLVNITAEAEGENTGFCSEIFFIPENAICSTGRKEG